MEADGFERLIIACESSLATVAREVNPFQWAALHMRLGNAFQARTEGDAEDNLDRAIEEYELALEVFSRRTTPQEWAGTLANLAICLQVRRRGNHGDNLERVIRAYTQCLRVLTRQADPEQWAALTVDLGVAYLSRWHADPAESQEKGIRHLQRALTVFTRESFPYDWATTLSSLGAAWANRIRGRREANLERAISAFQEALEVLDPRTWAYDRAGTLVNLGAAYRSRGRGDRAENLEWSLRAYREAMRLRPREVDSMKWASTLLNLSLAYMDRIRGRRSENLEHAFRLAAEALEILTAEGDPLERARALLVLSDVWQARVHGDRKDNLEKAIAAALEVREIATRERAPRLWENATASLGAAILVRPQGDRSENLESAIGLFERLLEVRTRESAGLGWARTMTNLAIAYRDLTRGDRSENLERAIELLGQALKEKDRGAPAADRAITLIHLASSYQERLRGDQGENVEQSIRLGLQAVKLMRRGNAEERALALMVVGISMTLRVHGNQAENLEAAITAYRAALKVLRNAPRRERFCVLANLGAAYFQRQRGDRAQNLEAALRYTRHALRMQRREEAPTEWAGTLNNLGRAYAHRLQGRRKENVRKAVTAFQSALEVSSPESLPHNCRMTARELGDLLAAEKRWDESAAAYGLAMLATETLYRDALLPRGRELELAETGALAWRQSFALARAGRWEEAVTASEQGCARDLVNALAQDRYDLGRIEADRPEIFEEYRQAIHVLRELELADRAAPVSTPLGAIPISRSWENGQQVRERLDRAVQKIRAVPGFESFLREAGFNEIVEAVPYGGILVYLAVTPYGSVALCVSNIFPERVFPLWTSDLTSEKLDHLLGIPDGRNVGQGYLQGQLVKTADLERDLEPILARLGRDLLAPLASRLRESGAHSIFLVPGGKLSLVPLHAALTGITLAEDRQPCLLDEVNVTYVPAARVLAASQAALAARKSELPSLGGLADSRPDVSPLRHARVELSQIEHLFPPSARYIAMGEEATREVFLRIYGQVTYLHLACHGQFDGWDPLGSSLFLARDEKLELRDILALNVSQPPRLVVLSACQTGIHEFQNTPDESIGLPAGFLRNGVPGVVASLWPVDDFSTALLMVRFYEFHLHGESDGPLPPARALRRAQLWLRDISAGELRQYFQQQRRLMESGSPVLDATTIAAGLSRFALEEPQSRPFAAPYYWAPFFFIGV